MVALFDISDATVERYIASHGEELKANGYTLLRGGNLNEFKGLNDVALMNEGNKAPVLGVFTDAYGLDEAVADIRERAVA